MSFLDRVKSVFKPTQDHQEIYHKERLEALREAKSAQQNFIESIEKQISKGSQSLNSELYGSDGSYSIDSWSNDFKRNRRLSRIAYYESSGAQALIGRFVDLVYGPKLEPRTAPIWNLIPDAPRDRKSRNDTAKDIESRWKIWASQKNVDYYGVDNHYQRARKNFMRLLIDGEYFVVLRYSRKKPGENPLTVQFLPSEAAQRTSSTVAPGNKEIDGIEYRNGRAVAYHFMTNENGKSVRISRTGTRSGRQQVMHVKNGDSWRGEPLTIGIINDLTKMADYQSLELQASLINALFAVWVETEQGGDPKKVVSKKGISGISSPSQGTKRDFSSAEFEGKLSKTDFSHGGFIVQEMGEGQKLHSFDTQRPTAEFQKFIESLQESSMSAVGMASSAAMYRFDESYSASLAVLHTLWNKILTLRYDHSTDYEKNIYSAWILGEIDAGRMKMPQKFNDSMVFAAWTNTEWVGPVKPDIDPVKTTRAAEMDAKNSWKTDQQITRERGGGEWQENVERKLAENQEKADANEPIAKQEKTTYSFSESKSESTSEVETND